MKTKTFWYFLREAATGLSRNGLMSITTVVTITLSLLILGCFYIVVTNFNNFAEMAKGTVELKLYLEETADATALQEQILKLPGVQDVRYVSRVEGAQWLEKSLGVKDIFTIEDNPLPDSLNIKLQRKARVSALVKRVKVLPGVAEVVYSKSFVEFMIIVVKIIWVLGISLVTIIALVVIYIIVNTIRLTVFSRRKEIEIMKLVGATDWFIRWPFLLEGIILGLSGALLAMIILIKGYHLLFSYVKELTPLIPLQSEAIIANGLLLLIPVVGLVFGAIGSMMSIKKFLRV